MTFAASKPRNEAVSGEVALTGRYRAQYEATRRFFDSVSRSRRAVSRNKRLRARLPVVVQLWTVIGCRHQ
ncbi:hypothetical protein EYF80_016038 [Liparis tanakae]|uniref:Uncharacterized protein n=1 Tax=Liparis tanakae TaxID=230148 RepID=A0A4Z2I6T9_9TELE|nr:hypothetical protein EYF80_016038 [Liparis tanakae]